MNEYMTFENRNIFRKWLSENHDSHEAVCLVFGKGGKIQTISYDEALQEALCFGWIDGQVKSIDDTYYVRRFSHRRELSHWSQRNKDFVEILTADDLMTEFGLEEIERAKKNGKWFIAERKPITQEQVDTLIKNIGDVKPALTNFLKMSSSVQKTYAIHYLSAKKEETKKRRLLKIIDRLNNNLKPM